MSETGNHDRHYDVLGLKRGASLPEIDDAWRLRSAVYHPDKFPAESKKWATGRTQEINNARDELRRYWRERERQRAADQTEPEYELRVRRAPPHDPNPVPPSTTDFEPAAAAASAESAAAPDSSLAPGLRRGAVFVYAAAALFVFMVLLGTATALLRDTGGGADARSPQVPEPPGRIAASPSEPVAQAPAPSGERPIMSGVARTTDALLAPKAAEEPPPAAGAAPEREEVSAVPLQNAEPAPEARAPIASAPPQADGGIQFPPTPTEPSAQATRPVPPPHGRAKARSLPSSVETSTPPSAAPPSRPAVQQPPSTSGRQTLVVAAMQACRSDLQRFCPGVQPGGGRLAQCARQNFRQLSNGCSQALLAVRSAQPGRLNPAGRN